MEKNIFLIIGGTTKAGTTSLFSYLSDHPEICPAQLKETRFFLDHEYPLKKLKSNNYSRKDYLRLFKCDHLEQIKLEATPDYLYSPKTAKKIANILNQDELRFLFILRNPLNRFISWYKFAIQDGKINKSISLDQYFNRNLRTNSNKVPQHLCALRQGKYSNFITEYINCFGRDKIKIIYFTSFVDQTNDVLKEVCEFVNIEPGFYDSYVPKIENETKMFAYPKLHRKYKVFQRTIRESVYKYPAIKQVLKTMNKNLRFIYKSVNSEIDGDYRIDNQVMEKLNEYYQEELKLFNNKGY